MTHVTPGIDSTPPVGSSLGEMDLDVTTAAASSSASVATADFTLPPVTLTPLPHLADHLKGLPVLPTPIDRSPFYHPSPGFYIGPSDIILRHILFDLSSSESTPSSRLLAYHRAGPRRTVRFKPSAVRAAIVTCGGLCPGLNTVIRELVVGLWEIYGVRQIFGVPSGYRGFYSAKPVPLDPKMVDGWHKRGGTVLTTSRGGFDAEKIVDGIVKHGFDQVRRHPPIVS
ncbi:hypothetical protein GW17_00027309 [Ensete ventricosum]|nr:hypothetical protein GW17_00027309 [Ensete ventricosum]RZR83761.1 hypothetical protein BHM03_00010471 [Ensete ventricosum]